jgi:hypothetical protein
MAEDGDLPPSLGDGIPMMRMVATEIHIHPDGTDPSVVETQRALAAQIAAVFQSLSI